MLPFGLVVVSFGISLSSAYAKTLEPSLVSDDKEKIHKHGSLDNPTVAARRLLYRYAFVILIGTLFFYLHPEEQSLQLKEAGEEMRFSECAYFSTVLATTVGYGHRIVARSDAAKAFCIAYMLAATTVVGQIIGGLSRLSLDRHDRAATSILLESVTWLHKADILRTGKLTESDYCIFKLQELQKVEQDILPRAIR